MIAVCMEYAKKCHVYQQHGDFNHQPTKPLHAMACSWPFAAWGMDIIVPINSPSSKGHIYILAATDCFFEWAKTMPLKEIKHSQIIRFVRVHIIYMFDIPVWIIIDNGQPFVSSQVNKMLAKFNIKLDHSFIIPKQTVWLKPSIRSWLRF